MKSSLEPLQYIFSRFEIMSKLSHNQQQRFEAYKTLMSSWQQEFMKLDQDPFFARLNLQSTLEAIDTLLTDADENIILKLLEDQEVKFMLECLYNSKKMLNNKFE